MVVIGANIASQQGRGGLFRGIFDQKALGARFADLMISHRNNCLLLTMVGTFAIGVFSASAIQFLPEIPDTQLSEDLYSEREEPLIVLANAPTNTAVHSDRAFQLRREVQEGNNSSVAFASNVSLKRIDLCGHQNITVNASPGETVTLDLRRFALGGNSTFTLQGAATTTFIIRVRNQFALTRKSQVVLAGDLRLDNVIFHIRGQGDAISLNKQTSLEGMVMANRRTVRLSGHSTVRGQVIAKKVRLRGASQVIPPPPISP